MQYRHQEALTKSVMLGHASQTSGVVQNVHDKPGNLSDPDIFTFDSKEFGETAEVSGFASPAGSPALSLLVVVLAMLSAGLCGKLLLPDDPLAPLGETITSVKKALLLTFWLR